MAPSPAKSWPPIVPPWGRRRTQLDQDAQQLEASTTPLQLRRSSSAIPIPTTPSHSADGAGSLQTPPTEHVRRLLSRPSSQIGRRHAEDGTNQDATALQPQYVAYSPNLAPTLPRSAPSIITSFPVDQVSTSTPQPLYQQHVTVSPSTYGISHSYPVSVITSPTTTLHDPPEGAASSGGPRLQSEAIDAFSSVVYTSPTAHQPSGTMAESFRGFMSPSDPRKLQRSSSTTAVSTRRESEATDAFTSPSEYALFVAATSSLSIGDATAAPVIRRPVSGSQVTPARLAAPLPPVPQAGGVQLPSTTLAQPRTQSLPPQQPLPQTLAGPPNRSQMVAEALLGLEHLADEHSSDDELPDYATSQMEANARQRWEATQRARELDEAWRRRRRGM